MVWRGLGTALVRQPQKGSPAPSSTFQPRAKTNHTFNPPIFLQATINVAPHFSELAAAEAASENAKRPGNHLCSFSSSGILAWWGFFPNLQIQVILWNSCAHQL